MKYTKEYQKMILNENAIGNLLSRLLGLIKGGAVVGGLDNILPMAANIGQNIRHNEWVRSGAKAGFGGSVLGGSDLISKAVLPNIQTTDIQRALGLTGRPYKRSKK
tara:strand:- start:3724 stop:4041 length:318 start_codon:yes stop_codon:yes gene_type:complete